MGDAILGKKPALDKLGIDVANVKKFRSSGEDRRRTQMIQALEKRYKGANARAKAETPSTEPSPTPTASPTPNPTPTPTPTPTTVALSPEDKAFADAGGEWINTNTWGGRSKDDLNELISMASLNDVSAQARMVRAGRAIILNQGQRG